MTFGNPPLTNPYQTYVAMPQTTYTANQFLAPWSNICSSLNDFPYPGPNAPYGSIGTQALGLATTGGSGGNDVAELVYCVERVLKMIVKR